MAVTDHYDFRYIDPDEEISEFPDFWNHTIDGIDEAIHDASANDDVAASRITGTIADAQLPNDIVRTGTVDDLDNRITENTRLIGINDDYISGNMSDISDLDERVGGLDSRVTELENAPGGGDGGSVYDSGVRNINSLFPGADLYHPNSLCTISRFGPIVTLTLSTIGIDGTGNVKIGDIPAGFRPPSTLRLDAMAQGKENIQMAVRGGRNDLWAYDVPSDATGYTAHITYRTPDDQPTELPGEEV